MRDRPEYILPVPTYEQVSDKQEAVSMTEHKIGSREEWQAARE
jgi:hypothetical protein